MPPTRFRPLAGVNYNPRRIGNIHGVERFRPLAGVNYNPQKMQKISQKSLSFRPLAGVNYNELKGELSMENQMLFPSPCGGEL